MSVLLRLLPFIVLTTSVVAQQDDNVVPAFRLEPDASSSFVTAMKFSPDGQTLYVAGWNKTVQVWELDSQTNRFFRNRARTFRVPIGPGVFGAIQTIDVSSDGKWLAVGGLGWTSSFAGYRESGYVWPPVQTANMQRDLGAIYLFNTATRETKVLRGHKAAVRSLTFFYGSSSKLVSTGSTGDGSQDARVWSVKDGQQLGPTLKLPQTRFAPRVVGWTGARRGSQVVIGLVDRQGLPGWWLWDTKSPTPTQRNSPTRVSALTLVGDARNPHLVMCAEGGVFSRNPVVAGVNSVMSGLVPRRDVPLSIVQRPTQAEPNTRNFAVATVTPNGQQLTYSVTLSAPGSNRLTNKVPLWTGSRRVRPVIAAGGKYLAVAGKPGFSISIHEQAKLAAGRNEPIQTITRGPAVVAATFVQKGEDRGLLLRSSQRSTTAAPQADDRVLDVSNRKLDPNPQAWRVATDTVRNWRVAPTTDRRDVVVTDVRSGQSNTLRRPTVLQNQEREVTAFAVRDRFGANPAIVVVATHEREQPSLEVWNAETGVYLRKLNGHTQRITSLVFSADKRTLLSAAEDYTVRGWQLNDLATTTIGRVGWVSGLKTRDDNDKVRVATATAAAQRGGLRAGDEITATIVGGKSSRFTKSWQLFERIARSLPPTNLGLRVRRNGVDRNIAVAVSQGADERKPLFSLSLLTNENTTDWVTWVPLGRYDTSRREIESMIGWHFNTGDAAQPTRFTSAQQMRKRFRDESLLQSVITNGELGFAPYEDPIIHVSVADEKGDVVTPGIENELFVRHTDGALLVELEDVAEEAIRTVECAIAGQQLRFERVTPVIFSAPLDEVLKPGQHALRVDMLTSEDPPRRISRPVSLRYQPPAPVVEMIAPTDVLQTVDAPSFEFAASISATKPAMATLQQVVDGEVVDSWKLDPASRQIRQTVKLRNGANVLRLRVRNRDIAPSVQDFADAEATQLTATVILQPKAPPRATISSILDSTGRELAEADANSSRLANTAAVTIRGSLKSTEALTAAWFEVAGQRIDVDEIPAGAREHAFSTKVSLEPGANTVKLHVESGKQKSEITSNVYHRPALPAITLRMPLTGRARVGVAAGTGVVPIDVAVTESPLPYSHDLLVDGRQFPATDTPPFVDGILSGKIPVPADATKLPDSHSVVVRIRNQWGAVRNVPVAVTVLHRPVISELRLQQSDQRSVCRVSAAVATPDNRPIESVQVRVNDVPATHSTFVVRNGTLTVSGITLPVGQNTITVTVTNSDGPSNKLSGELTGRSAPKPPVVAIRSPVRDSQVTTAGVTLMASVGSDTDLTSAEVTVKRDDRRDRRYVVAADQLVRTSNAASIRQPIRLDAGVNRITLRLTNETGTSTQQTEVTYLVPPLTLELTQLVPSGVAAPLVPIQGSTRTTFGTPLRSGRATLKGRLTWLEGHKPSGDSWTLRLWTNGFLLPVRVIPSRAVGNQLDFEMPLVLGQSVNHLRLEPVGLPIDEAQRAQLADIRVQSEQPDRDQNLHLLIVGVEMVDGRNKADGDELRTLAERALRLQARDQVFRDVRVYGPLTGRNARGRTVLAMLSNIARQINREESNDVVMLYYRGTEHQNEDGVVTLVDAANWRNPSAYASSMTEEALAERFEYISGAHVVLLDVDGGPGKTGNTVVERWPQFPNLGLLRVSWSQGTQSDTLFSMLGSAISTAASQSERGEAPLGSVESAVRTKSAREAFQFDAYIPQDLATLIMGRVAQPE